MGSTDQKVKISFVPLKFSLSPMGRLARGVELFRTMPIDRLHHADPSEHHRAIVLSLSPRMACSPMPPTFLSSIAGRKAALEPAKESRGHVL